MKSAAVCRRAGSRLVAGETTANVRRRIGAAARAAGHTLTIRRTGDAAYFGVEGRRAASGRRRRGRGSSSQPSRARVASVWDKQRQLQTLGANESR